MSPLLHLWHLTSSLLLLLALHLPLGFLVVVLVLQLPLELALLLLQLSLLLSLLLLVPSAPATSSQYVAASLALALGLASISSSKMKVESLFIDEGFGTLDPTTLSIAMDALERLHNQGRKVGVISHVEEMKERIPVEIRVVKESNGKSKVVI